MLILDLVNGSCLWVICLGCIMVESSEVGAVEGSGVGAVEGSGVGKL